jgi:hypothetical protein
MRAILAPIVYGLIPESSALARRPGDFDGSPPIEKSMFWTMITALVYCSWFALVIYISTLWRDRVDVKIAAVSQYAEGILLGKKSLVSLISSMGEGYMSAGDKIGNSREQNDLESRGNLKN